MGDYYIYIVDISRFSSLPAGKIPTGYLHKTFVDDPVPALIKRSFTSPLPTAEDSALARATTTTTPNLVFIKLVFLLPSPSFPFPLFCTLSLSPPLHRFFVFDLHFRGSSQKFEEEEEEKKKQACGPSLSIEIDTRIRDGEPRPPNESWLVQAMTARCHLLS